MLGKKSRLWTIHGLAALAGAGTALWLKPRPAEPPSPPSQTKVAPRGDSKMLTGAEWVDGLIADLARKPDEVKNDPFGKAYAGFRELLATLEPTDDPGATFRALLVDLERKGPIERANPTPEQLEALTILAVRLSQWIEVDPKAALAAMAEPPSETARILNAWFISPIVGELCDKQGLRAAMVWLPDLRPAYVAILKISEHIGKHGSVDDLRWLMSGQSGFSDKRWEEAGQEAIGNFWPLERRDELVAELSGNGKVRAMLTLARRMDGTDGAEWLRAWIDGGGMSADEVKSLTKGGELRSLLARLDAPLDERVVLMQSFGVAPAEISHAFKAQQIVHRDISGFLFQPESDQDWLYWFRNGEASANDVYDAVLTACHDPGSEINEFRSQMFRHLAEEDLDRAMDVLDGMPEQEKDWQKAYAARWWFTGANPNDFYQLTSSIAYQNDPKMQQFLSECWRDKSRSNLERFGDGYVEWIRGLPEGQDRTWALNGLEQASRDKYPGIHGEVLTLLEGQR